MWFFTKSWPKSWRNITVKDDFLYAVALKGPAQPSQDPVCCLHMGHFFKKHVTASLRALLVSTYLAEYGALTRKVLLIKIEDINAKKITIIIQEVQGTVLINKAPRDP